jgi:hypothetical protein
LARLTQNPQDPRTVEPLAFTVLTETHRCHILRRTDANKASGPRQGRARVERNYCVQSPMRFPDIFMTIA